MTDNIEILSPAGDFEALTAAVSNGADAIYLGGARFSARRSARNFSNDELRDAVAYAHLRGVKIYAAVNTLVHEDELEEAFNFIKFCYSIGVDALIIQDLGLVYLVRSLFPDFNIHASTQMTIYDSRGAEIAARLGFKRVVLSREMSFEEIKSITDKKICETEVFVHGALCMCYSGQCLMSSVIGGRSGNRGACAQPCRLKYTVCDGEKRPLGEQDRYYMSLKDICMVQHINRLKKLGVTSLKIEGRMKSSEYTAVVTSVYNKYRDGSPLSEKDAALLENIFSRSGFTDGYAFGNTGLNMLNYKKSNDGVYNSITSDVHKTAAILKSNKKTVPVDLSINVRLGLPPVLRMTCAGMYAECTGEMRAEAAENMPTDSERIIRQISKLGDTPFHVGKIESDIDDGINIPISGLNKLRRDTAELLEQKIVRSYERECSCEFDIKRTDNAFAGTRMSAGVLNFAQARAAFECGFDRIYVSPETYNEDKAFFDAHKDVFCLRLPPVIRGGYEQSLSECGLDDVCISNISQFGMFKDKKIYANYNFNIFNSLSLAEIAQMGAAEACLSPELTAARIKDMPGCIPTEVIVYGSIPLMTVRNCLIKSASGKCGCKNGPYYLRDRRGVYFPVAADCRSCVNTIYNSVPIYMGDKMSELDSLGVQWYRFEFTFEDSARVHRIRKMYEDGAAADFEFTRGHYYRGVL